MVDETLLELPRDLVVVDVGVASVVGDAKQNDVAVEQKVVCFQNAPKKFETFIAPSLKEN